MVARSSSIPFAACFLRRQIAIGDGIAHSLAFLSEASLRVGERLLLSKLIFNCKQTDRSVKYHQSIDTGFLTLSPMLNFYYHPLSPISRRVWVCLLEKEIAFESTTIQLQHKEQFQPEFLAINPFHHVPAIVDGDVRLIESIAILDYLDRVYPQPAMTPETPAAVGKMRMIQMVTTNEIMTTFVPAIVHQGQIPAEHPKAATLSAGLTFMESELGDGDYFGGKTIDLADCVAGVTLSLLRRLSPLSPLGCLARSISRSIELATNRTDNDGFRSLAAIYRSHDSTRQPLVVGNWGRSN
jgi:glutathione S-transferase